MRSRCLVVGVMALVLVACSADPSTEPAAAPRPAPPIDDTLIALGQLLDEDGSLSVDAALSLFAATVAPLPGVVAADLPGAVPHDVAGVAIRRLQAARATLSVDVQAAVQVAVEPQTGEDEVEVATGRHRELPTGDAPVEEPSAAELADMISTVVADVEELSGHDLRLPIRARLVPDRATGGDAITTGIYAGDRVTGCRIALPHGLFGLDGASVTSTIAHEVWHCFQLDADEAAFDTAPLWVIEGQAEWAGEAYVGGSSSSAGNWSNWLLAYHVSLFRRSYDAIGLYADAAQAGNDPWRVMLDMLGRENFGAVQALFGTSVEDALRAVAMADVRDSALGPEWETTGPGITDADGSVEFTLEDGAMVPASVEASRFSVLPLNVIVPSGDIARIGVRGGFAVVQMPGRRRWTSPTATPRRGACDPTVACARTARSPVAANCRRRPRGPARRQPVRWPSVNWSSRVACSHWRTLAAMTSSVPG